MVARTSPRRRAAATGTPITSRHLLLAALGAVSLARREARTAASIAVEEAGKLRGQARRFAMDARYVARGAFLTLQEKVEPQLGKFSAGQLSAEVEARLAPVLEKLGLTPARKTRARMTRKTARPVARRTTAGRKRAGTRVARKGRG